jgi:N-carbamoyl-L-amino-acid hydrolase
MFDAIRINGERLWASIQRSGEIGVGRPGGLARLALSDADREMRDLFVSWCREAGCEVTIDRLGSIFARREGTDASLPPVVMGSHLDTQVNGGKYDGIVGVLAGLEVIRALNDHDVRTQRPIELVSWTNEEGARFSPPMVASGAFAGVYPVDWVLGRLDDDDKRFGDELARIGYAGLAPVGGRPLDAYFELHIEQGPILDAEGIDVGVVVRGYAVRGFLVEVRGETSHTGPTPMDKRRNALVGAAMLAVAVNDVGWRCHPTGGKATAAWLLVKPNQPGILSDSRGSYGGGGSRGRLKVRRAVAMRDRGDRPMDVRQRAVRSGVHRPYPEGGAASRRPHVGHRQPGRARRLPHQ